jgi:hypothetical protein
MPIHVHDEGDKPRIIDLGADGSVHCYKRGMSGPMYTGAAFLQARRFGQSLNVLQYAFADMTILPLGFAPTSQRRSNTKSPATRLFFAFFAAMDSPLPSAQQ